MTNNDILRRIRYALDLSDNLLAELCRLGECGVDSSLVAALLKKEGEDGFLACSDTALEALLNGLIIQKRGVKKKAPDQGPASLPVTNNTILKKLRIALELQEDNLMEILALAECPITRPKLNALFRKEGHKNYRECGNQFLRNFLQGLALYYRQPQRRTVRSHKQEKA
jgi:uncharacterized protein YehS (DUF1456 family)